MDCAGCGKKFKTRHTTRLLRHFAKKSKGDIGVCTHRYTSVEQIQFNDLLQRSEEKKKRTEAKTLAICASVAASTENAALARKNPNDEVLDLIKPQYVPTTASHMLDGLSSSQSGSRRTLTGHFPTKISSTSQPSVRSSLAPRSWRKRPTKKTNSDCNCDRIIQSNDGC